MTDYQKLSPSKRRRWEECPGKIIPRSAEQIEADRAFLVKARKRSPIFPNVNELLLRRQQKQETIAARVLLGLTAALGLAGPWSAHPGLLAVCAVACLAGFVITCFVAGNRRMRQQEISNG